MQCENTYRPVLKKFDHKQASYFILICNHFKPQSGEMSCNTLTELKNFWSLLVPVLNLWSWTIIHIFSQSWVSASTLFTWCNVFFFFFDKNIYNKPGTTRKSQF